MPFIHDYEDPIEKIHYFTKHSPNSIAIQSNHTSLTYFELGQKMRSISSLISEQYFNLHKTQSMTDIVIMVIGGKCVKSIVVCLSIMNCGAAYLPVDETFNSETRIRQIYNETKAKMVISNENILQTANWISIDTLWIDNADVNIESNNCG